MISVEEAFKRVKKNTVLLTDFEEIHLCDGLERVLFEDVVSPIDMPPFRQSAMDGYAVHISDLQYNLIGEVPAGSNFLNDVSHGEAVRIFTGAKVPDSAHAVVMQEKVSRDDDVITLDSIPKLEENIRPKGEQVKKGALALNKGTKLNAASIGYLASLGITRIKVFRKPKIAIVATGDELVKPGEVLPEGKIFESNTIMLNSAVLASANCEASIYTISDDYTETKSLMQKVVNEYDLVMISGGISVGDYDFVGKALREMKVDEVFYKVKQKPGKKTL